MATEKTIATLQQPTSQTGHQLLDRSVWFGYTSLALAAIEAVCVFLVSASGLAALVGGFAITLSQGILFFHSAAIRLPILAVATLGALLNLWLMWNHFRLRNAPAAQWRIQPLTSRERTRIGLVTTMSVLTLVCVAAELYFHHRFHGSAFS
jgi:hypothetical protein